MVFRIPRPRRYGRLSALGTVLVLIAVGATAVVLLPAEQRKPHSDLAVGRPGVRS
jgi:hypothetical protein